MNKNDGILPFSNLFLDFLIGVTGENRAGRLGGNGVVINILSRCSDHISGQVSRQESRVPDLFFQDTHDLSRFHL